MKQFWSFIHNCVAHPLLFWTGEARWATWFHNETAKKWLTDEPDPE